MSEQRDPAVRVSTLLDLYGAPRDTPGFEPKLSGTALADRMLAAIGERIGDSRFLPYIQVHEFEALVFASLEHLPLITADGRAQAALATELARCEHPEALDGGSETAPSKRLKRQLPFYDKVAHGADLTAAAGLNTLRERCPRFGAWVTALEASVTGFASP